MTRHAPTIAITCGTHRRPLADGSTEHRYESAMHYANAVTAAGAGATPLLLPFAPDHIDRYLELCDGFILSGGDDPATEAFGEPTHPEANRMHPDRQTFELALLEALDRTAHPVLGICLGMQLMALHHGGQLHQHLPDLPGMSRDQVERHRQGRHAVERTVDHHPVLPTSGEVHSHHHQTVADPGAMRTVAVSDEATGRLIEAIDAADRFPVRFYLGLQWHPERTAHAPLGVDLIARFVDACRR